MDPSSLYELIERFHRTNQLPAFLVGIAVCLVVSLFVLRRLRVRIGGFTGLSEKIDRLERRIEGLSSENDLLQDELQ